MAAGGSWHFANLVVSAVMDNGGVIFGDCLVKSILVHHHKDTAAPTVIHAYMTYDNMRNFQSECRRNEMKIDIVNDNDLIDTDTYKYVVKMSPSYWQQCAAAFPIPINMADIERQIADVKPIEVVVTFCHDMPDQLRVDAPNFECYCLMASRKHIMLSPQVPVNDGDILGRHNTITRILDDIVLKKTKPSIDVDGNMGNVARLLIDDGWIIYDDVMTSVKEEVADDVCIMCLDKLPVHHFKLVCCNARYHAKCLKACMDNGYDEVCIHCKGEANLGVQHSAMLHNI
jgi:hypothetical protein